MDDDYREALLRAAGGPEVFLSMRAAYTSSLAAVSIAGYVAGVGDRHTDNFLVDLSSGSLVPIDFGYVLTVLSSCWKMQVRNVSKTCWPRQPCQQVLLTFSFSWSTAKLHVMLGAQAVVQIGQQMVTYP